MQLFFYFFGVRFWNQPYKKKKKDEKMTPVWCLPKCDQIITPIREHMQLQQFKNLNE
jgi:hypothetical protein